MSDAELREGLGVALGRPVGDVRRRPWAYASSAPLEALDVAGCPPLLFKDLGSVAGERPAFVADPLREVEVYASFLSGLDAPVCHGALVSGTRVWLFLERVDGIPLWQAGDVAAWEAAASWLARLHAAPVPRSRRLLHHDAAYLGRWVDRALALAAPGSLEGVEPAARRAVALLAGRPASFVHGELYPSNVLVQRGAEGPRVRPIDWETAGVGPDVLDVAALTSGAWEPARRARVIEAYRRAAGAEAEGFGEALHAARLLVALQWVGWSPDWSPPRQHARDWAAEARSLAREAA